MSDDDRLDERCLESSVVYQGGFLQVRRDRVALPDATEAMREYIVHPGAVMVVPMFDDGRVVIERQFRYPLHRSLLEFPAGKIDPNEDHLACAVRELREETGYSARDWHFLGTIHNAIGYSDEHIEIYLATGLSAGERQLDAGEFLDVLTMPLEAVIAAVDAGEITDVKTIIGAYWVERHLRRQPR